MEKFYVRLKETEECQGIGEFEGLEQALEFAQSKFGDKIEEVFGKECVWEASGEQIFLRATEET